MTSSSASSTICSAANMSCISAASGGGPPSRSAAREASSGTGRHVEPARSASDSTWITAARTRPTESREIPVARAIVSAI